MSRQPTNADHEPPAPGLLHPDDLYRGTGTRPIPDPTVLTTEQLNRAIAGVDHDVSLIRAQILTSREWLIDRMDRALLSLREVLEGKTSGDREVLEARIDGMDEAVKLLQTIADRVPGLMDQKIGDLHTLISEHFRTVDQRFALQDEKFASVQTQFTERDTRSERESRDNKVAVDAAFAAQKEAASKQDDSNQKAIEKSERATAETLAKQGDLGKSTTDALAANISDLKERATRIEGQLASITANIGEATARNAELARDFGQQKGYAQENYGRASGQADNTARNFSIIAALGAVAAIAFEIARMAR